MPQLRFEESEIDWTDEEQTILCYSSATKFILPVPDIYNLDAPYGFDLHKHLAMDGYGQGVEIRNPHYRIFEGHGDAFLNPTNHETQIVRYDLQHDERNVIIINHPTAEQARLLQQKFREILGERAPEDIKLSELQALMRYAREELGLQDQYVSNTGYIKKTMRDYTPVTVETTHPENHALYGHKKRIADIPFRAVRVLGKGALILSDGMPEYFSQDAVILRYPNSQTHLVRPDIFQRDYHDANGLKIEFADIPIHEPINTATKPIENSITIAVVGAGVSGLMAVTKMIQTYLPYAQKDMPLRIIIIDPMSKEGGFTYNRHGITEIGMANPINQLGIDHWDSAINHFNRNPEKWRAIIPHVWGEDGSAVEPEAIITHNQFGEYLRSHAESLIKWLETLDYPVQVEFRKALVIGADQQGRDTLLQLAYKRPAPDSAPEIDEELKTDATILCTGNVAPRPLAVLALNDQGLPYDADTGLPLTQIDTDVKVNAAYRPGETLLRHPGYYNLDDQAFGPENVHDASHTTLIGTGNGALFAILAAEANGYSGTYSIISPTAELPQVASPTVEPHGELKGYIRQFLTLNHIRALKGAGQLSAQAIKGLLHREIEVAESTGYNWRAVVDSLSEEFYMEGNPTPAIEAIYTLLSPEEQARFLNDLDLVPIDGTTPDGQRKTTKWGNARYRIPDAHWHALRPLLEAGRLEIINGHGFVGVAPHPNGNKGFRIFYREETGEIASFDSEKIVNNTGPSKQIAQMPRLIRDMAGKGLVTAYKLGGINISPDFRLVADPQKGALMEDGHQFYALGPLVSGASLASMTVPEIRAQAETLARAVIEKEIQDRGQDLIVRYHRTLQHDGIGAQINYLPNTEEQASGHCYPLPVDPNDTNILSTASFYQRSGHYTPERKTLHEEIIEGLLAGKTPLPGKAPQFIMVGGGMSVGMTYMKRLLETEGMVPEEHVVTISPFIMGKDEKLNIRGIPEFNALNNYQHPERSQLLNEEYYDIVNEVVRRATERGISIAYVDMGDDIARTMGNLQRVKAEGYDTALFGLTVDTEGYFQAANRWQSSFDRATDHPRALRIMRDFTRAWQDYTHVFDDTMLVETEYANSMQVAHPVMKTSQRDDGSVESHILDPERLAAFQARTGLNTDAQTATEATANLSVVMPDFTAVPTSPAGCRRRTSLREAYDVLTDDNFSRRFEQESRQKLAQRAIRSANIVSFEKRNEGDREHATQRASGSHYPSALEAFTSDEQRIVQSPAFARLGDISQYRPVEDTETRSLVFNRRTHTLYAIEVAEELAKELGLSPESIALARAITAAHDIGHAPFAHRGETVIQRALRDTNSRWDHDMAALSIVHKDLTAGGLDLSLDVIESMAKRYWRFSETADDSTADRSRRPFHTLPASIRELDKALDLKLHLFAPIEGQIATAADWIAFTATDMGDALRLGEVTFSELIERLPELAGQAYKRMMETHAYQQYALQIEVFSEHIKSILIGDVVLSTAQDIAQERKEGRLKDASDVRQLDHTLVHYSDTMKAQVQEFGKINHEKSQATAHQRPPFRDIMSAMLDSLIDGSLPMREPWKTTREEICTLHLPPEEEEQAILGLAVEYFTTALSDQDVWEQVKQWRNRQNTTPPPNDETPQTRQEYTEEEEKKLIIAVRDGAILSTLDIASFAGLDYPEPREKAYQRLVESLIDGKPPAAKGNYAVILGGGPNSGKSTLRAALELHFKEHGIPGIFISASDIKKALPEYAALESLYKNTRLHEELGLSPDDIEYIGNHLYHFTEREVSQTLAYVIEELTKRGYPVVVETHLHDLEEAKTFVCAAQKNHGKAILMAPDVNMENFFHRGLMREATQGKFFMVSPSLNHQQRFEENWPDYAVLFDVSVRFDNNGNTPVMMAFAGKDHGIEVTDPAAYHQARQKIRINLEATDAREAVSYEPFDASNTATTPTNSSAIALIIQGAPASMIQSVLQNLQNVSEQMPRPSINHANTHTRLEPEDLHGILNQLRLQGHDIGKHCLGLQSIAHTGAKNSTYQFRTERGTFVVSILEEASHDHNSSVLDLEKFHHFLHQHDCGVPVAKPIGQGLHHAGKKIQVTTLVEGRTLEWLDDAQLAEFSKILGYLHKAGRYLDPYGEERPAAEYAHDTMENKLLRIREASEQYASDPVWLSQLTKLNCIPKGLLGMSAAEQREYVIGTPTFLEDRLETRLPELLQCPYGKVHGDIAPGNIIAGGSGSIVAIIDLMSGKENYLVVEIAEAIYRHAVEWRDDGSFLFNAKRAELIIERYNAARPLLQKEIDILPAVLEEFAEIKLARRLFCYPEPKGFSSQQSAIAAAEHRLDAVREGLSRQEEWMPDLQPGKSGSPLLGTLDNAHAPGAHWLQ